ncbi:unnamed protein product, partial [Symbiodinium pilosum]
SCRGNVSCSTFQIVESQAGTLECWQGTGYDCFQKRKEVKVRAAKRFMRGRYRVLKDLRGFEVTGLQYAFSKTALGSDVEEAVKMCNHTCLSSLQCQAWRYSTGDGCWFDRGELAYPPTTDTFIQGTEAAALVVAGAYVQRICEVPQDLHEHVATTTIMPAMSTPPLMTPPPIAEVSIPIINATALPKPVLPAAHTKADQFPSTSLPSSSSKPTTTAMPTSTLPNASHAVLPRARAGAGAHVHDAVGEADKFPGSFLRVLTS